MSDEQPIDYKDHLEKLLMIVGSPGKCKSCGADIWWVTTRKRVPMPVNRLGLSHFSDCPHADAHRKKKGA